MLLMVMILQEIMLMTSVQILQKNAQTCNFHESISNYRMLAQNWNMSIIADVNREPKIISKK